MRYTRFITALAAFLVATSCAVDDVDSAMSGVNSSDAVTVLGRITRFDDKTVDSRGVKDENEAKLTSMAMAIFPVKEDGSGLAGNCVYYQYSANQQELLFTIERGTNYTYNQPYVMYVFVNMPGMEGFGQGSTLAEMMEVVYNVENLNIPENGFPMMGSLGDTFSTTFDKDNQTFILSPTDSNNHLVAPTVGGTTQNLLTIPMKAMYAKVNFTIEVRPDQQIEGNYSPQFTMKEYKVNNVPSTVDFSNGTNSDTNVLADSFSLPISGNTVASGANKINFTFYLPERLLNPATSADKYDYPFPALADGDKDENGNGIRDEDEVYRQRFKSQLLGSDQKATNIVISGTFRDHQNHYWDVDYTIYLGEDNYGDFNIKRNSEYNNYVTIRGIQSSDDMSDNADGIAIDHRVNVARTQPAIISLRRETLLDSHFEVRPLRIRKSDVENVDPNINAVQVEVVNPTTTTWMRIERSFGDGTLATANDRKNSNGESFYITDANSPSYGKRRYFTYDLINGTVATNHPLTESTTVVVPLSEADECVWIYVDECTEAGDGVRAGIIRVTYGNLNGSTFTPTTDAAYPVVNYTINQRKLFEVTYGDNTYYIEYEEEYLHNFDADDNYGSTEYDGMAWGLNGLQLSHQYKAYFATGIFANIMNWLMDSELAVAPYYDFYLTRDINNTDAERRDNSGYDFCSEIIQTVNGSGNINTDTDDNIDVLPLNQQPQSAIEYCYNKNKRNSNGQVAWQDADGTAHQENLNWYLPAIDEIENIMSSTYTYEGETYNTYSRFLDFQGKPYWSSQPAFLRGLGHYYLFDTVDQTADYYFDDKSSARATKIIYNNTTQQYENMSSGVDGYAQIMDIYKPLTGTSNDPVIVTVTNDDFTYTTTHTGVSWSGIQTKTFSVTVDKMTDKDAHPGNMLRASKARIRCVRKMQ